MHIQPGHVLPDLKVRVETHAMKTVALLLRDPNPIHLDPHVVAALGLGDRVINQGPVNAAYVWELLEQWLGDSSYVRSLDLRYTSNAFGGEDLTAGGVVEELDQGAGTAVCAVHLRHDDGTEAVRGRAVVTLPPTVAHGD
jgi:3-hydroxybutyryl-CoA dehydratase